MDPFIAHENVRRFRNLLWTDLRQDQRSQVQRLLVEEEDKLAADLALLDDLERHIADGGQRIDRQRERVTDMERDGHKALPIARALLDGMVESQTLHIKYRECIVIAIKRDGHGR